MNSQNHSPDHPKVYQSKHYMPAYRQGDFGDWRISVLPLGFDHGYFTKTWMVQNMPVLMRRRPDNPEDWETWMSLSPHEIESQELGIELAYGHTVIMGLGMGWLAVNAAMNPKVTHVSVIEIDQSVIRLLEQSGALEGLPETVLKKIEIIRANALEWKPSSLVDFLYADIWKRLNEPDVIREVRVMQQNIQAESVYFWGQEMTLYSEWNKLDGSDEQFDQAALDSMIREHIRLPLNIPADRDYARFIQEIIANRAVRGLGV